MPKRELAANHLQTQAGLEMVLSVERERSEGLFAALLPRVRIQGCCKVVIAKERSDSLSLARGAIPFC